MSNQMTKEAYLALQQEAEDLEMDHAKGQDLPHHQSRLKEIDEAMTNSQWTLSHDHGCVLVADLERLNNPSPTQRS